MESFQFNPLLFYTSGMTMSTTMVCHQHDAFIQSKGDNTSIKHFTSGCSDTE